MNLNFQEIVRSYPLFWDKKRQEVLKTCLGIIEEHGLISQELLQTIISQFSKNSKPSLTELKTIESILTRLKNNHGVNTVIPPIPITPPRNSILPASAQSIALQDGLLSLESYFWSKWLQQKLQVLNHPRKQQETLLFAFAFSLALNEGMRSQQIIDAIVNLRHSDLGKEQNFLKLKVHPKDKHDRYMLLFLSSPTKLILNKILSFPDKNRIPHTHMFLDWIEDKFKKRKTKIREVLNKQYLNMLEGTSNTLPTPSSWIQFAKSAYLKPLLHGIEPFILTCISRYPLPVSHPETSNYSLLRCHNCRSTTQNNFYKLESAKPKLKLVAAKKAEELERKQVYDDWSGSSKTVLIQLVARLEKITNKKIRTPSQVDSACFEINQSLDEANNLTESNKSALHLALFWIKNYIKAKRTISPKTINNYFERVFYQGLLNYSDSDDLTLWSSQDHELAFEESLSRRSIQDSRRNDIISTYRLVYNYAAQHGFTGNIDVKFIGSEWVGSTMRSEVVGLFQFDSFIEKMMKSNDRQRTVIAVAAILAFYGGLRSSEVTRLTLKDVSVDEYQYDVSDEIYIEVLNGKTPAARRRIPIHLFAPSHLCEIIKTYYQSRLREFKERDSSSRHLRLKNIPLLGPVGKRNIFTRKSLIGGTIIELKCNLNENLVYHSLRHSFVSWTLLRWYTNRYPKLREQLSDEGHDIFKKSTQMLFCKYFTYGAEKLPDYHSNDLIKLSKVVGHNGQETMFSTYIHSFSVIHHHAMQRISKVVGQRKLNGETIAVLMPKMKSRKSQAKVKDKTINGLIAYESLITSNKSDGEQLK